MQIKMNSIVNMTYEIKDIDGNILESSSEPVEYLHGGFDNIFPKVEEAMHGKKIGDEIVVSLEPADAFGTYDESLVQIEPTSAFPENELKQGMQFEGEDSSGEVITYTVTDIADGKVIVDGNHPWAGQRIIFTAIVGDIRLANDQELKDKNPQKSKNKHH
jgi:FKBP-type peptidyl-prolyl cis-trans isomerase SlyD